MVVSLFWVLVGGSVFILGASFGGEFILGGCGWWWMVVGRGVWWHGL